MPDGGIATGIGFTIAWQRGALNVEGRNGAFILDVLQVCQKQLEYYQSRQFACEENAQALQYLVGAIDTLESRRNRRDTAGTLGTHQPDEKPLIDV